jgi:hypothetical protein
VRGVRSSPAFKWFVLLLLPLTLAWKVAVRPAGTNQLNEGEKEAQRRVAEFLMRQHFVVTVSDSVEEGRPTIVASAGPCRIQIAKSPAVGWDRDLVRRYATPADEVFVVFRGRVYAEQPTWLTTSDYLWARLRRELGLGGEASLVLALIATRSCDAERLPWNELGLALQAPGDTATAGRGTIPRRVGPGAKHTRPDALRS